MSDIPKARQLVAKALQAVDGKDPKAAAMLATALGLMVRAPYAKPVAPRRPPMPPEVAEAIRAYVRAFPHAPVAEVGRKFGVDGGRVSEAINHLR